MKKKINWLVFLPLLFYIIIFAIPFLRLDPSNNNHFFSFSIFLSLIPILSGVSLLLVAFEFVFVSLFIYWITSIFIKKTSAIEGEMVNFIIALGYLLWAIPLIMYSMTCTGKICGIMIIVPIPEAIFFIFSQSYHWGKLDGALILVFCMVINIYLVYLFSSIGTSHIVKKSFESREKKV